MLTAKSYLNAFANNQHQMFIMVLNIPLASTTTKLERSSVKTVPVKNYAKRNKQCSYPPPLQVLY